NRSLQIESIGGDAQYVNNRASLIGNIKARWAACHLRSQVPNGLHNGKCTAAVRGNRPTVDKQGIGIIGKNGAFLGASLPAENANDLPLKLVLIPRGSGRHHTTSASSGDGRSRIDLTSPVEIGVVEIGI